MKKTVIKIILIIVFLFFPSKVFSQQIAGHSATITYNHIENINLKDSIIKKIVIHRILNQYTSPLSDETDIFIRSCKTYNLDCYLLPAITGLESYFGHYIYPQSYNPFGWGGGYIMFDSWEKAIITVAKGLRENYINKGATTVNQIGAIYAESPTWAVRVNYFKSLFEQEEEKLNLLLSENKVEL